MLLSVDMTGAEVLSITLRSRKNMGTGNWEKLVDSAIKALNAEGIHKAALVAFEKNVSGNAFGEKVGFTVRDDLVYRNKYIHQLKRVDLIQYGGCIWK